MRELHERIRAYAKRVQTRLHMPGHKGNKPFLDAYFCYEADVTELEESDDLHRPRSVLLEMRRRAARFWSAKAAYLLTNGATSGNLIALHALWHQIQNQGSGQPFDQQREKIVLIDRHAHRSCFHALRLLKASYRFIAAPVFSEKIPCAVNGYEEVKRAIESCPDAVGFLVLTQPTYEGLYSTELKKIVDYCHQREILVYLDAAHGAHLPFLSEAEFNPGACGVDLFTMSLHKTLNAATSTAILCKGSDRVETALLDLFFDVFETSSPSYPLLLSIEDCLDDLETQDLCLAQNLKVIERLKAILRDKNYVLLSDCIDEKKQGIDPFKMYISAAEGDLTPLRLAFRESGLRAEYDQPWGMLLMFGVRADYRELERVFWQFSPMRRVKTEKSVSALPPLPSLLSERIEASFPKDVQRLHIEEAVGQKLAEDLFFYPPGIPFRLQGERLTREDVILMQKYPQSLGLETGQIRVVDE